MSAGEDEDLLDTLGKAAFGVGVVVIIFAIWQSGSTDISAVVSLVRSGATLMIVGILAVVGGAALVAWAKNRS